jgi:hypothetical protein
MNILDSFPGGSCYLVLAACLFVIACSNERAADTNADGGTILMAKNTRPLTDIKYESSPERVARGKYLTDA